MPQFLNYKVLLAVGIAVVFAQVGVRGLYGVINYAAEIRRVEPTHAVVERVGRTIDTIPGYTNMPSIRLQLFELIYSYEYRGTRYSSNLVSMVCGPCKKEELESYLGEALERMQPGRPVSVFVSVSNPKTSFVYKFSDREIFFEALKSIAWIAMSLLVGWICFRLFTGSDD